MIYRPRVKVNNFFSKFLGKEVARSADHPRKSANPFLHRPDAKLPPKAHETQAENKAGLGVHIEADPGRKCVTATSEHRMGWMRISRLSSGTEKARCGVEPNRRHLTKIVSWPFAAAGWIFSRTSSPAKVNSTPSPISAMQCL